MPAAAHQQPDPPPRAYSAVPRWSTDPARQRENRRRRRRSNQRPVGFPRRRRRYGRHPQQLGRVPAIGVGRSGSEVARRAASDVAEDRSSSCRVGRSTSILPGARRPARTSDRRGSPPSDQDRVPGPQAQRIRYTLCESHARTCSAASQSPAKVARRSAAPRAPDPERRLRVTTRRRRQAAEQMRGNARGRGPGPKEIVRGDRVRTRAGPDRARWRQRKTAEPGERRIGRLLGRQTNVPRPTWPAPARATQLRYAVTTVVRLTRGWRRGRSMAACACSSSSAKAPPAHRRAAGRAAVGVGSGERGSGMAAVWHGKGQCQTKWNWLFTGDHSPTIRHIGLH